MANEGHLECESYSIGSAALDTIFGFKNFQGTADFFIAKRTQPTSSSSSSVVLSTKFLSPQQVLIASKIDREYWGAQLGVYYFCAQAYDTLSGQINVIEGTWENRYISEFEYVYNSILHTEATNQFLYED